MMMVSMVRLAIAQDTISSANGSSSAIDVVLKRENTPFGFDRSKAKGYKETDGYKCYGSYLCEQLAKSTQSDDCITNAESWAMLNVVFWLTRTKPKWHCAFGEAIRREGDVPDYLPYTRRQDRDKEIVLWVGERS